MSLELLYTEQIPMVLTVLHKVRYPGAVAVFVLVTWLDFADPLKNVHNIKKMFQRGFIYYSMLLNL